MTNTKPGALELRILKNISYHARRLAQDNAVPGMDASDYEQDIAADLLRRSASYDPKRASFPTFADRIVRHRASTLRTRSVAQKVERSFVSLDSPIRMPEGDTRPFGELIPDERALSEDDLLIGIDMRRFLQALTPVELQGCQLLLGESLSEETRLLGINRSTGYERIHKVRDRAAEQGLADCLSPSSLHGEVSDPTSSLASGLDMKPRTKAKSLSQSMITHAAFKRWLFGATAGESIEYHRGVLALDRNPVASRLPQVVRSELDLVATAAQQASERRRVHLLQRRYGAADYGYLAVVRPDRGGSL